MIEQLRVGTSTMDVHLGVPERKARGPAVLLMYHRGGFDDFTIGVVDRLVRHGYLVAVPDVYHRSPKAIPVPERKALMTDVDVVADIEATLAQLRARADVAPDRIAIMGHCMGGRMALLAAGRLPAFCGVVVFYGGGVMRSWGEGTTPFERLRHIRCPVIGFFGNEDKNPSPEEVDQIDAELTMWGVEHDFHRYPGVGHGFQNPARDAPRDRAAAEDGWTKTLAFLGRVAPPA